MPLPINIKDRIANNVMESERIEYKKDYSRLTIKSYPETPPDTKRNCFP